LCSARRSSTLLKGYRNEVNGKNGKRVDLTVDPIEAAKNSGLRYVTDGIPGFRRKRSGTTFRYFDQNNKPIRDKTDLARIKALAVPPAWADVWISPFAHSHLQATGRDARGRKQYRYHKRWREVRDQTKYDRMILVAQKLPALRLKVARDLALPGLPREKIIATVVKLLETTFIRVGNEEYARENRSFGLTTLRNQHVQVKGDKIYFRFRGKSGVGHELELANPRLARIVKRCQDMPGQQLFEYLDENGEARSVESSDVNEYLREATGEDFTAKDFRTWAGTVLAARAFAAAEGFTSKAQAKRNVARAIDDVANKLGNTRSVCQKCYVHPAVVSAYMDGTLHNGGRVRRRIAAASTGLSAEERAVVRLLQRQIKVAANGRSAKLNHKRAA
jgi:DNA topoisomerase-1